MKKSLVSTLCAVSLLSLSSMVHASEPDFTEPFMLSASEMDDVTAGKQRASRGNSHSGNSVRLSQINISPVIIIQIALFNSGGNITQIASVISGNFATIRQ
jgi:hypothetical protein